MEERAYVDLFWIPLGAGPGGGIVRLSGRVYELTTAGTARRPLYHSALEVGLGAERYVIEMAPVWRRPASERGVVAEGAVGAVRLGRWRLFRYEVRCWRDGSLPDAAEAVDSPLRLSTDPAVARGILALAPDVPRAVWGRDELRTGDMWNSNSLTAWLLARSELDTSAIRPPRGGRAPGWVAGLKVARSTQVATKRAASATT